MVWADEAVAAAISAAAECGLAAEGARLLRVGENAAVVLPVAGALARVIRSIRRLPEVSHELDIAAWLASEGVPVTQPLVPAPAVVKGRVVSFWEYIPDATAADLETLGRCLRRLHQTPWSRASPVRPLDPFDRFDERLATAATLKPAERDLLTEARDKLATQWEATSFERGEAVIHGDAHMENLLRSGNGRLAFIDLEAVSIGPPEWDLTLTALYHEIGWFTGQEYARFTEEYGYDVRQTSGWPMLRSIQMLQMTTWLAQSASDYPERAEQLHHRISTLRDGSAPAGWTGY